jgi:hypothetical protein
MNKDEKKKLVKEFDNLKSDVDKWKWMIEHKDCGIIIMLDNDDTTGLFKDDIRSNDYVGSFPFDEYLGLGGEYLLTAIGIENDTV